MTSIRYVPRGNPFHGTVAQMKRKATPSDSDDRREDAQRIARAGIAPDASVEAEEQEHDIPRDENRGQ